jgi:drug/metabolite transporter (DMT)-like permease
MTTRATGVALAFVTAVISGISIWVNARAVRHFGDATVYTTAKNAVAAVLLLVIFLSASHGAAELRSLPARRWVALVALGIVGGSVPFVLFFEGLTRAEATQGSFIQ